MPELLLEYNSEALVYYVLPNISKSLLHKKAQFMESHKQVLGLIDFEFTSMPPFEVAQRELMMSAPEHFNEAFEESIDEQEIV